MDKDREKVVVVCYLRVLDNKYGALNLTTQKWNRLVEGLISILRAERDSNSVKLNGHINSSCSLVLKGGRQQLWGSQPHHPEVERACQRCGLAIKG